MRNVFSWCNPGADMHGEGFATDFILQLPNSLCISLLILWTAPGMLEVFLQSKFTKPCCSSGRLGFGSRWIMGIFSCSSSNSPLSDMKGERDCYLHFYALVYFSCGNRNSMSRVESQCCCVLKCIRLPFHLHLCLTAPCFPKTRPLAYFSEELLKCAFCSLFYVFLFAFS